MIGRETSVIDEAGATVAPGLWSGEGFPGFEWAPLSVPIFSGLSVLTRFSVTWQLQIWGIAALRFGIGAILSASAILGETSHDD